MKNENLNKTNTYSPTMQFLMTIGLMQIILCVIRVCGGLVNWPMEAVLMPAIFGLCVITLAAAVVFVILVIALVAPAMKKGGRKS